jgi:hypothetical protein
MLSLNLEKFSLKSRKFKTYLLVKIKKVESCGAKLFSDVMVKKRKKRPKTKEN